jgi:hypothetical protein
MTRQRIAAGFQRFALCPKARFFLLRKLYSPRQSNIILLRVGYFAIRMAPSENVPKFSFGSMGGRSAVGRQ